MSSRTGQVTRSCCRTGRADLSQAQALPAPPISQGQVSRVGMGQRAGNPGEARPGWSGFLHACLLSNTDAGTLTHQQSTWPRGLGSAPAGETQGVGGGEWLLGRASLPFPSSSSAHFLSQWEQRPPPPKRPRKLPAIRVRKAWGAVTWPRPRLGLHGRDRGSGSPKIRGSAKTCLPLAPWPG